MKYQQVGSSDVVRLLNNELWVCARSGDRPRTKVLVGPTGLGKSTIVRDFAAMIGATVVAEDLSLRVPGDLGMPVIDKENMRHTFTPPQWWPEVGAEKDEYKRPSSVPGYLADVYKELEWPADPPVTYIVILEELLRARDDVLASAMELLLNGRIGQYEAPPWVWFIATTNLVEDGYRGTTLDPAQEDRLQFLYFSPTREEWKRYCTAPDGVRAMKRRKKKGSVADEPVPQGRSMDALVDWVAEHGLLRVTDSDERTPQGEDAVRITPRRAFLMARTVHFSPTKYMESFGEKIIRQDLPDPALSKEACEMVLSVRAGDYKEERRLSAKRLLDDDTEAWGAFDEALKEKDFGVVSAVIDEMPNEIVSRLEAGEDIPETATRFIKKLDDEYFRSFGLAIFAASEKNEKAVVKLGEWDELINRAHDIYSASSGKSE